MDRYRVPAQLRLRTGTGTAGAAYPAKALGGLVFAARPSSGGSAAAPVLAIEMPVLSGAPTSTEYWLADDGDAVSWTRHGLARVGHCGDWAFAVVEIDDARFATAHPLRQAAAEAYRTLFGALSDLHFAHPVRFWNYLPAINRSDGGLERYRQFNVGRHDAFVASGRHPETTTPPAACALGHGGRLLQVAALAARSAPIAIENPRQVSAYRYPRDYGPRSPTFSRACLLPGKAGAWLFLSGTASIVGHETRHRGDLAAQIDESLRNAEALLTAANARLGRLAWSAAQLHWRAYLRHASDADVAARQLARWLPGTRIALLNAGICRSDLLFEIEAAGCEAQ